MSKPYEIKVRVSQEERNRLRAMASKLGLTLSSYLRFVGLHSLVEPVKVKPKKK